MNAEATKPSTSATWRFLVTMKESFVDARVGSLVGDIVDLGVEGVERVEIASAYYCSGTLSSEDCDRLGASLLSDPITQDCQVKLLDGLPSGVPSGGSTVSVEVAYRPGVRDPVEDSFKKGARDCGITGVESVHTASVYTLTGSISGPDLERVCEKLLVNATIQQIVTPENLKQLLSMSSPTPMVIETVHLLEANDTVLQRISLDHQLSLNLEEMKTIRSYYRQEKR